LPGGEEIEVLDDNRAAVIRVRDLDEFGDRPAQVPVSRRRSERGRQCNRHRAGRPVRIPRRIDRPRRKMPAVQIDSEHPVLAQLVETREDLVVAERPRRVEAGATVSASKLMS